MFLAGDASRNRPRFACPRLDWKGLGYLVSIVSVFFLGAIAWPKPERPQWHWRR